MTKRVQLIRHDNAGASAFEGKLGEIAVNTGNKSLHVHDGINAGGTELSRADLVNVAVAAAGNAGKMSAQQSVELAQALLDIAANLVLIQSNDVDIAANLAAILTNDTDIATNASGLAQELIDRAAADAVLQGQITSNDGDIATNASGVATNAGNISTNTGNILTNTNKLAGIEAGADVTDTANVTAAGALMDSEVDADIKTLSLPASTTISAFGRTLIDDAAASNARTTLGLGALAIVNSVNQGTIDANSVGQSELKDATGSVSVSSTTGITSAHLTLPGGSYGFYVQTRITPAITRSYIAQLAQDRNNGTDLTSIYLVTDTYDGGGITTTTATQRYFTASKPYDLGDGEVGRFIFALIDNTTGHVDAVYQAPEAPWHYNGPTDIQGKLMPDGKKYRFRKDMSGHGVTLAQAKLNMGLLRAYSLAFQNAPMIQEEITQAIKQADMGLIPHPFTGNNLTGKTVVMLDPVSDLNFELDELSQHAEFSINDLLHDGYLNIDNTGLARSGPAGIMIPAFSWKNTL